MENFLKIYIQKIQQNLKAVAFLTIQFFRERADFSTTKKTSRKEFSTMQYPTETWIEYPLLSFFFESNFFGLKVPFMFDFAVCLPWLSIFFSFFKSQKSVSGRNYCFDSQFLLFTRTVTKRFTRRWHIFFLVLIDLWFVAL